LNEKGESIEWVASGWSARIVQHEMDHLDGKFYTDHMDRESFNCAYWHSVNVRSGRFSLTFGPFKKW
jgi:peptide deformylase